MKKLFAIFLSLLVVLSSSALSACNKPSTVDDLLNLVITKEDYAEVFNDVASSTSNYILNLSKARRYLILENDLTLVAYDELNVVIAAVWLVGFLKNICETESFILTDEYIESKIFREGSMGVDPRDMAYLIRFNMSYAEDKNTIYTNLYCEQKNSNPMFISYEIIYDFEQSTLRSFILKLYFEDNVFYFTYENNNLYILNTNSDVYQSISADVQGKFNVEKTKTFGEDLYDFTVQYYSAAPRHLF